MGKNRTSLFLNRPDNHWLKFCGKSFTALVIPKCTDILTSCSGKWKGSSGFA